LVDLLSCVSKPSSTDSGEDDATEGMELTLLLRMLLTRSSLSSYMEERSMGFDTREAFKR
jgi:hypothetical protein